MQMLRALGSCAVLFLSLAPRALSQEHTRFERFLGIPARQRPAAPLPGPDGLRDHVVNGKLVVSLEDGIRLALANDTDIRLDHVQIETAENSLHRSHQAFDPLFASSFSTQRAKSPSFTQLAGALVPNQLTQNTQVNYSQTFQTGAKLQTAFGAFRTVSNSSNNFINPSISTSLGFTITQPLLRGRGLFPNRAPILIARRNLRQSRDFFESQVNDTILTTVQQYWGVVQARENLNVQRESLGAAQKSYDHDKKALELGALPPLDIYRSESQVASRRVAAIQAEYALKQAEDQFRRVVGADLDPAIRALDLELPDTPEPGSELLTTDIATALERALAKRPELQAAQEQLAQNEMNVRLAHNSLQPDLELSLAYSGNGVGGNQLNPISTGGLTDSLNQTFHFTFPTYGFSLSLNLPIKNHAAEASLGDALVSRRRTQYQERQTRQGITLEVTNAVHMLEQAKLSVEAAKVALDLAQKNLHAEERKYELGAQTVFFVLEAQTELAQAELSLVQAQIGYQLAVAAVDHATGDLLTHHHVQIVEPTK